MKKFMLLGVVGLMMACTPKKEVVDVFQGSPGMPGTNGQDGISCSVMSVEGGASLMCGGQAVFLANGQNGADGMNGEDGSDGMDGADGSDGADGQDGTDGQDGVAGSDGQDGSDGAQGPQGIPGVASGMLTEVVLNSCTLVESGIYAKLVGSGSLKLYSNHNCSGNSMESLSSEDEIFVLVGGNMLIFQSTNNKLFKLVFN